MSETMVTRVARALRDADAIWAARKFADLAPEEIRRMVDEAGDECGYEEMAVAAIKEIEKAGDPLPHNKDSQE